MSITVDTVRFVARLARLQLLDEEARACLEPLSGILDLMQQLQTLPTDGVEPMSHAVEMSLAERLDEVVNSNQLDAMLANAPDSTEGCFRVPKIIE